MFFRYTYWLHLTTWLLAFFETLLCLILNSVDSDPISGLCFVGAINHTNLLYFFILPISIKILLGLTFLSIGLVSAFKMVPLLPKENQRNLKQLIAKLLLLACVFLVPTFVIFACFTYEIANQESWQKSLTQCEECQTSISKPAINVVLLKFIMILTPGIASTFWVVGRIFDGILQRFSALKTKMGLYKKKRKERKFPHLEHQMKFVRGQDAEYVHLANRNLATFNRSDPIQSISSSVSMTDSQVV